MRRQGLTSPGRRSGFARPCDRYIALLALDVGRGLYGAKLVIASSQYPARGAADAPHAQQRIAAKDALHELLAKPALAAWAAQGCAPLHRDGAGGQSGRIRLVRPLIGAGHAWDWRAIWTGKIRGRGANRPAGVFFALTRLEHT